MKFLKIIEVVLIQHKIFLNKQLNYQNQIKSWYHKIHLK